MEIDEILAREAPRFIAAPLARIEDEISAFLGAIGAHYAADRCLAYFMSEGANQITKGYEWCDDGVAPARPSSPPSNTFSRVADMIRSGRPWHLPDVSSLPADAPERASLDALGVKSAAAVPFHVPEVGRGFISLHYTRARRDFEPDEGRQLALAGEMVSYAIARRRDLLERESAEATVRALADELEARVLERTAAYEEAYRELESFSYTVSHDLRAPIRHVLGFTGLMVMDYGDVLPAGARDQLDKIEDAAKRMGRLIEDLTALAAVSRRDMNQQAVDLAPIARELCERLAAEQPSRDAEFVIPPSLPVRGDVGLLRIALDNLLANAWKFSGGAALGPTRIEVGPFDDGIFVRDNGIGFDVAHTGKLFEPFVRLHAREEYEGTGIGLATVARVARRHGGSVRADASPGNGATFYLHLGAPSSK